MRSARRLGLVIALALGMVVAWASVMPPAGGGTVIAQVLSNPYRIVEGWAKLPNGRKMGAVGKVAIAPRWHPHLGSHSM